ncbi:hypothetical protein Geu3261_0010_030 [Komagataeibacter europaeus NBRC 3261]|uniref:Uncharacterized protein n=1 Tax=Komagataeibacter europaeus NBRC 3261 TaxID=1234669 RepID=A0A0D6PV82_KOMEU|nr:hypothetical protein Geu3261_0010_030 [Komagataeibacter europaeus NBRC 3261]
MYEMSSVLPCLFMVWGDTMPPSLDGRQGDDIRICYIITLWVLMPLSYPVASPSTDQDNRTAMQHPTPATSPAPLPITWMARAWWQRLACMTVPCGVLWGLIAWAISIP